VTASAQRAQCVKFLDPFGDHAIDCGVAGFFQRRHHDVRDELAGEAKAASFRGVHTEVVVAEWERDHPTRPGEREAAVLDVGLSPLPDYVQEYVDVHVFHCFTGSNQRAAHPDATWHERAKHERYPRRTADGRRAVPFSLVPSVFNSYGGLAAEGQAALKRWRAAATRPGGLGESTLARLALLVARRVAGQVLSAAHGRATRTAALARP
jgi:hypothetical protein